jgi:hypothetical protein
MTTTTKSVLGIIVVAVVALVGVYAYRAHQMVATESPTGTGLPTAATDTSDTAIDQDTAAIDAQLKATSDDDATVDQGIQTHSAAQ